jgi:hypothetical protein
MTKALLIFAVLALLPTLGMAQSDSTPAPLDSTGIKGTISAGPVHGGPEREGAGATAPLADVTFEVKQGDRVVSTFQTDSKGQFQISLPPGHYTISRKEKTAVGRYGPFEVDVAPGKMSEHHWECDTGLR